MIKTFPGRTADQDVTHQTDGAIAKAFAHIEEEAAGAVSVEVGTIGRAAAICSSSPSQGL